jgi:hypothetical protein
MLGGGRYVDIFRLHRCDAVVLGLRQHGDILGRRVTTACVSLLATSLFINSQRLIGDGASLYLAMKGLNVSYNVCIGGVGV